MKDAELKEVLVTSEEHRTGFAGQGPNLAVRGAAPAIDPDVEGIRKFCTEGPNQRL